VVELGLIFTSAVGEFEAKELLNDLGVDPTIYANKALERSTCKNLR